MKFNFENQRGETLSGNLELPLGRPRAFAVFAHCFTCSKRVIAAHTISKTLTGNGIGVLRFDFTGLGNSEGDFSNTNFSSNVEDLLSAYKALEEQYQSPQLLIGHSLGGAAVLKAAGHLPKVKAVVTLGAPSDVEHVKHLFSDSLEEIESKGSAEVLLAGRKFTISKQFVHDLNSNQIVSELKELKKALLVMHAPMDDTVSIDHAANIYQSAMHPKSFISLDNADHLLSQREDAAYAAQVIGAWSSRYLNDATDASIAHEGHVIVENVGGQKFTQTIRTADHMLIADEPRSLGGAHLGMNPYELLLSALGACSAMTMQMYARKKNLNLEKVKVELKHQKIHAHDCDDCETQEGLIDHIQKAITIEGQMSEDQKRRILEIVEKCPVNRTLQSEVKISTLEGALPGQD